MNQYIIKTTQTQKIDAENRSDALNQVISAAPKDTSIESIFVIMELKNISETHNIPV